MEARAIKFHAGLFLELETGVCLFTSPGSGLSPGQGTGLVGWLVGWLAGWAAASPAARASPASLLPIE